MNTTTSRKTKNSKAKSTTNESIGNSASHPDPEHIAIYAYFLWEKEGRPDGREVTHWLQAELQLQRGEEEAGEDMKS